MIDRAGAIVEGWCGHSARRRPDMPWLPLIRESAGRGDMDNDTLIDADPDPDKTRFFDARDGVIWDPRADMDDDGDVDDDDVLLWSDADNVWPESEPTVAQAFSDVGNPFMFQGVPHFALDTADDAETATLPLNHHRARFADPVTGRWGARDPIGYASSTNLYESLYSAPTFWVDPEGLEPSTKGGKALLNRLKKLCDRGCAHWCAKVRADAEQHKCSYPGLQNDCVNDCKEACYEEADKIVDIIENALSCATSANNCTHISSLIRRLLQDYGPFEFFDFDAVHLINVTKGGPGRHMIAVIGFNSALMEHSTKEIGGIQYRLWDILLDPTNWNTAKGDKWPVHLLELENGLLIDQHPAWRGGPNEKNFPFGPSTPNRDDEYFGGLWKDVRYKPGNYPLK